MVSLLGMGIVNVANYPLSIHLGGGTEGYGALEALLGGGGLVGAAIAARILSPSRAPLIVTVTFAVSGRRASARRARAGDRGRARRDGGRRSRPRARGRGRHDARPGTDRGRRPRRVFAAQDGAAHAAYSAAMLAGGLLVAACGRAHGRRDGGRLRLRGGIGCEPHAPE